MTGREKDGPDNKSCIEALPVVSSITTATNAAIVIQNAASIGRL
ncbi:hypothetical protein GCM10007907_32320 [Chitinimonas prasina]|uniref:Uncharacterized protein n=1 Tax=Chitinimonas prasina TaxID=1434937 RepID=A0ABQ5YL47_9NEIS|nr:hypothetical protein GCM10007907_32320 [Chitinimonas prasina]